MLQARLYKTNRRACDACELVCEGALPRSWTGRKVWTIKKTQPSLCLFKIAPGQTWTGTGLYARLDFKSNASTDSATGAWFNIQLSWNLFCLQRLPPSHKMILNHFVRQSATGAWFNIQLSWNLFCLQRLPPSHKMILNHFVRQSATGARFNIQLSWNLFCLQRLPPSHKMILNHFAGFCFLSDKSLILLSQLFAIVLTSSSSLPWTSSGSTPLYAKSFRQSATGARFNIQLSWNLNCLFTY